MVVVARLPGAVLPPPDHKVRYPGDAADGRDACLPPDPGREVRAPGFTRSELGAVRSGWVLRLAELAFRRGDDPGACVSLQAHRGGGQADESPLERSSRAGAHHAGSPEAVIALEASHRGLGAGAEGPVHAHAVAGRPQPALQCAYA